MEKYISNCCGAEVENFSHFTEIGMCPECKEYCVFEEAPNE